MSSSSTAAVSFSSDPSLAVIQPVQATTTNGHSQKSPELFHSHHYHARRQRDRQHFPSSSGAANNPSRSNSAADLSRQSSTINLSSNASSLNNVNNIKVSFKKCNRFLNLKGEICVPWLFQFLYNESQVKIVENKKNW
jgi:hypothetical protein